MPCFQNWFRRPDKPSDVLATPDRRASHLKQYRRIPDPRLFLGKAVEGCPVGFGTFCLDPGAGGDGCGHGLRCLIR
jgi:hypothetical protein